MLADGVAEGPDRLVGRVRRDQEADRAEPLAGVDVGVRDVDRRDVRRHDGRRRVLRVGDAARGQDRFADRLCLLQPLHDAGVRDRAEQGVRPVVVAEEAVDGGG